MIINRLLVLLLLYIEQLVIMNGINHLFVIIKLFYINIDIIYIIIYTTIHEYESSTNNFGKSIQPHFSRTWKIGTIWYDPELLKLTRFASQEWDGKILRLCLDLINIG